MGTSSSKKPRKVPINFKEQVSVLGTPYRIQLIDADNDPYLKEHGNIDGYCERPTHKIAVRDLWKDPDYSDESPEFISELMKLTLRHELVHAFFNESGLGPNCCHYNGPWSKNEEMVDWIAFQGPKIYQIWQEAGCLPKTMVPEWVSATATTLSK